MNSKDNAKKRVLYEISYCEGLKRLQTIAFNKQREVCINFRSIWSSSLADFQPKVSCYSQISRKQKRLEKLSLIKLTVCSEALKLKQYNGEISRLYNLLGTNWSPLFSQLFVVNNFEMRSILNQEEILTSLAPGTNTKSPGMQNACARVGHGCPRSQYNSIAFLHSLNALTQRPLWPTPKRCRGLYENLSFREARFNLAVLPHNNRGLVLLFET